MISATEVVQLAAATIFDRPLVTNVYRSVLVEAMVSRALPDFEWCSADYAAHDFIHPDGTRLEVKQSAVKQSWATARPSRPSWDIKPRTGRWEDGVRWIAEPGRNAEIYVLGLHPIADETADHRNADQWRFFVIAARDLPDTQRISIGPASQLSEQFTLAELRDAVQQARFRVAPGRSA